MLYQLSYVRAAFILAASGPYGDLDAALFKRFFKHSPSKRTSSLRVQEERPSVEGLYSSLDLD
jgi:hypothetical protein